MDYMVLGCQGPKCAIILDNSENYIDLVPKITGPYSSLGTWTHIPTENHRGEAASPSLARWAQGNFSLLSLSAHQDPQSPTTDGRIFSAQALFDLTTKGSQELTQLWQNSGGVSALDVATLN